MNQRIAFRIVFKLMVMENYGNEDIKTIQDDLISLEYSHFTKHLNLILHYDRLN